MERICHDKSTIGLQFELGKSGGLKINISHTEIKDQKETSYKPSTLFGTFITSYVDVIDNIWYILYNWNTLSSHVKALYVLVAVGYLMVAICTTRSGESLQRAARDLRRNLARLNQLICNAPESSCTGATAVAPCTCTTMGVNTYTQNTIGIFLQQFRSISRNIRPGLFLCIESSVDSRSTRALLRLVQRAACERACGLILRAGLTPASSL
ncbi:hypothetical protein EVAR_54846_1 [Eumeta japonica]|uniref:Uncharacterized protein n=1 Tax=Eumeta variegata TaxID=151549 RepID=A0A4C1ZEL3_EUMVA|nr:hypothetical protein EVAR_54846_1 [Eumeta japonica]